MVQHGATWCNMVQQIKHLSGGFIPALNQACSEVLTLRANLGTFSLEMLGALGNDSNESD